MQNAKNIDQKHVNSFIADVAKAMRAKKVNMRKFTRIDENKFDALVKKHPDRVMLLACATENATVYAQFAGFTNIYWVQTDNVINSTFNMIEILGTDKAENLYRIPSSDLLKGFEAAQTKSESRKMNSQIVNGRMTYKHSRGGKSQGIMNRMERIDSRMNAHLIWSENQEKGKGSWEEQRTTMCAEFLAIEELLRYIFSADGYLVKEIIERRGKEIPVEYLVQYDDKSKADFNNLNRLLGAARTHMVWSFMIDHDFMKKLASLVTQVVSDNYSAMNKAVGVYRTKNARVDMAMLTGGSQKIAEIFSEIVRKMSNRNETFRVEYDGMLCDNPDLVDEMNPQELFELGYLTENEMPTLGEKITDEQIDLMYSIARERAHADIKSDAQDREKMHAAAQKLLAFMTKA